ncbi:hypothetical protein GCM10019016_017250 [Streptomyces prasinosporus]|uniref:Uncharacterized protein n=1 Tax=Streptomyces prasinosporus TaxID=68256 RepID=A0ABP6TIF4_9ACTN
MLLRTGGEAAPGRPASGRARRAVSSPLSEGPPAPRATTCSGWSGPKPDDGLPKKEERAAAPGPVNSFDTARTGRQAAPMTYGIESHPTR